MSGKRIDWGLIHRCAGCATIVVVWGAAYSQNAQGAAPIEKLPPPFYSFDLGSPHTADGTLAPGDVLAYDEAAEAAVVHIPAGELGLLDALDELDGLSGANAAVSPLEPFSLLLSITRTSVGERPPDDLAVNLNVPFNPADQAARGQASADQFMSLILCNLQNRCELPDTTGGTPRAPVDNMALLRNNYNEGGTGFGACPEDPAGGGGGGCGARSGPAGVQDNVDAMAGSGVDMTGPGTGFYFSVTNESPSVGPLSGGVPPSGANLFYNPDPFTAGTTSTLFAAFNELGLTANDDIDAMIVFDRDLDGLFNGTDVVLFSLTPDSPSVSAIADVSAFAVAADIFIARPGGLVEVFAHVADFGLADRLDAQDDVDAMDFFFCDDSFACLSRHGIRGVDTPIPALPEWGIVIMTIILLIAGSILFRRPRPIAL